MPEPAYNFTCYTYSSANHPPMTPSVPPLWGPVGGLNQEAARNALGVGSDIELEFGMLFQSWGTHPDNALVIRQNIERGGAMFLPDERFVVSDLQMYNRSDDPDDPNYIPAESVAVIEFTVISVSDRVLLTAQLLLQQAQSGHAQLRFADAALVVAQTACEVAVGRILTELRAQAGLPQPQPWQANTNIGGHPNNNGNVPALDTYKHLTNDTGIDSQPFWPAYRTAVDLRNEVIHAARTVSYQEASDAVAAYTAVLQHLKGVAQARGLAEV